MPPEMAEEAARQHNEESGSESEYNQEPRQKAKLRPRMRAKAANTVNKRKDGRSLCSKWNLGQCKDERRCGMIHQCDRMLKGGRACRMGNHTSPKCRSKKAVK